MEENLEKKYTGSFVKITSSKLEKIIEDKSFAIISVAKPSYSDTKNDKRNKVLIERLRDICFDISIYPIAVYYENDEKRLVRLWLVVNNNFNEEKFFEIIKNMTKKYNQNYFIFKGKQFPFGVYENEKIKISYENFDKDTFLNSLKQLLFFQNYFKNEKELTIFNSYFAIPKDNISGKMIFKRNYIELTSDKIKKIIES
jgi:hypothetical protein